MTRQVVRVTGGARMALAAYVRQIEQTQWARSDEIVRGQHRELVALARHATANSAPFRDRLAAAGLTPDDLATPEGLRRLPVMRRRALQALGESLFCTELPRDHQPVYETRTSGSTGEPVVVRRTRIGRRDWMAMTVRDHLWHRRDHTKRTSVVRATNSEYRVAPDWGAPMALLFATGPAQYIPITADLDRQWGWLAGFQPDTLLIYPSTLDALARRAQARGETLPGLSHIWTIGETLSPATRALAAAAFGPTPVDLYSSQEIGIIALQCPHSGLYHVAAECVLVEVLNERGEPCAPGEVGRVTVTDLHNFATPLIRYDIGDYAEAASACSCGRGLPTLARILGRERNLILMPDGARHWPLVGFARFRDVAPVVQYQLVQRERERIDVRLVVESPLSPAQETALGTVIREALGHDFALGFTYFPERIPPTKGGKFEEFVCEVA